MTFRTIPYLTISSISFAGRTLGLFGLSEKDKYQITSWAFSYFMTEQITISEAVVKAVKKVKPRKVRHDDSLKLSRSTRIELELRVKNML